MQGLVGAIRKMHKCWAGRVGEYSNWEAAVSETATILTLCAVHGQKDMPGHFPVGLKCKSRKKN